MLIASSHLAIGVLNFISQLCSSFGLPLSLPFSASHSPVRNLTHSRVPLTVQGIQRTPWIWGTLVIQDMPNIRYVSSMIEAAPSLNRIKYTTSTSVVSVTSQVFSTKWATQTQTVTATATTTPRMITMTTWVTNDQCAQAQPTVSTVYRISNGALIDFPRKN